MAQEKTVSRVRPKEINVDRLVENGRAYWWACIGDTGVGEEGATADDALLKLIKRHHSRFAISIINIGNS